MSDKELYLDFSDRHHIKMVMKSSKEVREKCPECEGRGSSKIKQAISHLKI